jgi:hypothetical protein
MATRDELQKAIDTFVAARKSIAGVGEGYNWGPGYSSGERKAIFPVEVNGELVEGARVEVVGFPDSPTLKFRLSLCFNAAICRLDYTDETHGNTMRTIGDGLPAVVRGPHFHSWPLNRRFFRGASRAPELHNAEQFTTASNFDSTLRWFCGQVNIDQPPGGHFIALPQRERLL